MESIKYFPGIMSENITLVSEEYTSRFVTGPELQTELSKKQDYVGLSLVNDQNVVQVDLRGFSQIGQYESNYFDGPVKFSSPIYDKNDNEITGGGGSETKAESWVVKLDGRSAECSLFDLNIRTQEEMVMAKVWFVEDSNRDIAIIKFTSEKSMAEVCEWLYSKALIAMGETIISNVDGYLKYYQPQVLCPWPKNAPWPSSN